jgi:hypothetical protein
MQSGARRWARFFLFVLCSPAFVSCSQAALAQGRGSILLSAHRSILNLFTDDIGIGGAPIYTNGLARVELNPDSRDGIALLSLTGADERRVLVAGIVNRFTSQVLPV